MIGRLAARLRPARGRHHRPPQTVTPGALDPELGRSGGRAPGVITDDPPTLHLERVDDLTEPSIPWALTHKQRTDQISQLTPREWYEALNLLAGYAPYEVDRVLGDLQLVGHR